MVTADRTDEMLYVEFAEGDHLALSRLYERYADRLVGRLMRVFHFDQATADDVAQQAWLLVNRERNSASQVRSFSAWLWRRSKSLAIDEKRRIKAKNRLHRYSTLDSMEHLRSCRIDDRHEYWHEQREAVNSIIDAVKDLPDDLRFAFRAVYLQRQPMSSVAISLGVALSTLRGRIERAKEYLRIIILD